MKNFWRSLSVLTTYVFSFKRLQLMLVFILPVMMLFAAVSIQSVGAAKPARAIQSIQMARPSPTPVPLISSVSATPSNHSYKEGESVDITVTFTHNVIVNIQDLNDSTLYPFLNLAVGRSSGAAHAVYDISKNKPGIGSANLIFTYIVVDGDTTDNLNYTGAGALQLPQTTTIIDTWTDDNADRSLPATSSSDALAGSNIIIDTSAPGIDIPNGGISSPKANGTYYTGADILITINFDEPVIVTGTPKINLNVSGRQASYVSGNKTQQLTFDYKVQHGDQSLKNNQLSSLDYAQLGPLDLSNGTITDIAGNDLDLNTLPLPGYPGSLSKNKSIVIDATEPVVEKVSSDSPDNGYNNWYKTDETNGKFDVLIQFSENIVVSSGTPHPKLRLQTNNTNNNANPYADCVRDDANSHFDTLRCTYTVQPGDNTFLNNTPAQNLDYINTSALTLNGATIQDVDNHDATLMLPAPGDAGSLSANNSIGIDTTAPTVSFTWGNPTSQDIQPQSTLIFHVTFSEAISGVDVSDFATHITPIDPLPSNTTSSVTGVDPVSDTNEFNVTVTITSDDIAKLNGDVGLDLSDSLNIQDQAGNLLAQIDNDQIYTLDSDAPSAPTISVIGNQGYINDPKPKITITVTNQDIKTITIFLDGSNIPADGTANLDKQSGKWIYTFSSSLGDGSHQITATATDKAGNVSQLSDPPTSFTVDTVPPTLGILQYPTGGFNGEPPSENSIFQFSSMDNSPVIFMCQVTDPPPGKTTYINGDCSTSIHQVELESDGSQQLYFIPELKDGTYQFWVYAIDKAGNEYHLPSNNVPALPIVWKLVQPPKLITPSNPSFDPLQIFEFSSQNDGATFTCSLDGNPFPSTACTSPMVYFGSDDLHNYGFHDFSVQTILADHTEGGIRTFHWLFNDTKIDTTPPLTTYLPSAKFTFSTAYKDSDPNAAPVTFQCQLMYRSVATANYQVLSNLPNCSNTQTQTQTYSALKPGYYIFQVWAVTSGIDTDGIKITVTDPTPAQYSWTILASPTPTPTPTPKERISNGGFDLYKSTSKIPTGWVPTNFATSDGKNTTFKKNGIASVGISGFAGKTKTLAQTIVMSGKAGDSLTFSFWARGVAIPTAGICQAQVVFYNGAVKVQAKPIPCKTGTYTAFQKQMLSFKTISAYTKIVVLLTYSKASGVIWFDMVSLIK